jgi:hypothetical protein
MKGSWIVVEFQISVSRLGNVRANASRSSPTEYLKRLISYDLETGRFTWLVSSCVRAAGTEAGSIHASGYKVIRIGGMHYFGHHLAWLLHYGRWPVGSVDHINLDKVDNRISNLREATPPQQIGNTRVRKDSRSGIKAVTQVMSGRWRARIRVAGKERHLGTFDTAEQATAAYSASAKEAFGEFARHGDDARRQ